MTEKNRQWMKIAKLIREKREEKGMSRRELANILGCSPQAVWLWESGKRKPGKKNILHLCRILDIGLEELGGKGERKRENNYAPYEFDGFLKKSMQLTVNCKRNRIYLKKNLIECLHGSVEISIHPENNRELLIREKGNGKVKKTYYSSKVVRNISRAVKAEGKMRFFCMRDEKEGGWRAVLLPEMTESYLWKELRNSVNELWEDITWKKQILCALNRRYCKVAEYEEIRLVYRLAYEMAVGSNLFAGSHIWYLILMYASALLDEIGRIQNRCMRTEAALSLDQPCRGSEKCTMLDFQTGWGIPHMRFEIGEFLEELSVLERIILRQLMEDRNPEGNINFGVNLKKLIREGIQSLQRKAENFYGRDYICSLLVMD